MARLGTIGRALLGCLVLAVILSPGSQAAERIERVVLLRDGTLITVSLADEMLPWRRMTEDGRVFDEPLKLSEIDRLRFVRTTATDQVEAVRKLAAQLGDPDFHKREAAQAELAKIGHKFRSILSEYLTRTLDMEVKWRLNVLLKTIPVGAGLIDFDLLMPAGVDKPVAGDAGPWTPAVKFRGAELVLDRAKVASLGALTLLPPPVVEPASPRVRRIEANEDRLFPMDVTRVDFDRGPKGEELSDERDIGQLFAPLGCTFAVSIPGGYISAQSYNVGGRSGGKCAATFSPRYQGTMTIRFCLPEYEKLSAGVRYVGLSVSHVAPKGTALQAYDIFDRLLGEVQTTRTGFDFLALKCNTPIAYVKVAPNLEVDKDFAIDDLVFDRPQALAESGVADRFSLQLTSGERLFCSTVEAGEGAVVLKDLSFGLAELKLPLADIAVVVPPRKPAPGDLGGAVEGARDCLVRTADGSVLRAMADGGFKPLRFPKLALSADTIVAFWGRQVAADMPDDEVWADKSAVLLQRGQAARPLSKWKLGSRWIESPDLPEGLDRSYADSPPVWLRQPVARPAATGLVRLVSGEELVLDATAFALKSWSAAGLVVTRGDEVVTIPLAEVAAMVLPRSAK